MPCLLRATWLNYSNGMLLRQNWKVFSPYLCWSLGQFAFISFEVVLWCLKAHKNMHSWLQLNRIPIAVHIPFPKFLSMNWGNFKVQVPIRFNPICLFCWSLWLPTKKCPLSFCKYCVSVFHRDINSSTGDRKHLSRHLPQYRGHLLLQFS